MGVSGADLITLIVGIIGGGGLGAILKMWLDHVHRRGDQDHSQYLAILVDLRKRITELEEDRDQCQRENATLREQVGELREAVRRLEMGLASRSLPKPAPAPAPAVGGVGM